MPTLRLDLGSAPSEVAQLVAAVEAFAMPFAVPRKALQHFLLAIEEITLNAIRYGGLAPPAAGPRVTVTLDDGELACEIIDNGRPFNPFTDVPAPDLTSPVAERRPGGLGVHLVKRLMDSYSYERRGDGNCTMLRKRLD